MQRIFSIAGTFPFLIAVFLNAFVDLGHKIVIQNTVFKMYDGTEQVILTAIVNGLILLPFILLFSPVGFASDRFAKTSVMRGAAWLAVALTCGITVCYMLGWFWVSFGMTFLLAVQSAFYSPAKYGYIKVFYGKERLAEVNGVVQAVSIVAILLGTLMFSILFELWFPSGATAESQILQAIVPVGFVLVACSLLEVWMIYRLPNPETPDATLTFDTREYLSGRLLKANVAPIWRREVIRLSIIGLAVFWSIGQVMLAAFPAFAKAQTSETNTIIIQAIIAASGLGIAIGSGVASRVSRNYIETGLIPFGALGIAIGLFVLPGLESLSLMALCFFVIGLAGGLFIVPLNAMIQYHAEEGALGRTLSLSNYLQNISMLFFLLLSILASILNISDVFLLRVICAISLFNALYFICKIKQIRRFGCVGNN
ncbi:MAG: MFS transporter [Pseudomonadota bacterium]